MYSMVLPIVKTKVRDGVRMGVQDGGQVLVAAWQWCAVERGMGVRDGGQVLECHIRPASLPPLASPLD